MIRFVMTYPCFHGIVDHDSVGVMTYLCFPTDSVLGIVDHDSFGIMTYLCFPTDSVHGIVP